MELLPDKSTLLSPGNCVICRCSPEDGHPVIDTHRDVNTPVPVINGRIYVCFVCAGAIARLIDYIPKEESLIAIADAKIAQHEAQVLRERAQAIFQEFNTPVEAK